MRCCHQFFILLIITIVSMTIAGSTGAENLSILINRYHHSNNGVFGVYFNGCNHEEQKISRVDQQINFGWGEDSPDQEVGADNFSVRWQGYIMPRYTENYTFWISKDDGCRLWIDDKLLINSWDGCGEPSATIDLEANRFYKLKVEFVEYGGGANISFSWGSKSQPREVVPTACLYQDKPKNIIVAVADTNDMQKGVVSLLSDDFTAIPITDQGAGEPGVSPAGQLIYSVGWLHTNWADTQTTPNTELYLADPDGKNQRRLKGSSYGENTPIFSADGKRIAFTSNKDGAWRIYTMNATGGQLRCLTRDNTENYYPAFSPDGDWVVYQSKHAGKWAIYRVSAKGGEETLLTNEGENRYPVVSPDGEKILFCSNRDGKYNIYEMKADGSEVKRLTDTKDADDTRPRYVSNGLAIGFISTRDGTDGDLYLMNTDGSKPQRLTTTGKICDFAWNL